MFKTYRVETLWSNEGDTGDKKVSIIRGSTKIEAKGDDAETDPLYNLGDSNVFDIIMSVYINLL